MIAKTVVGHVSIKNGTPFFGGVKIVLVPALVSVTYSIIEINVNK